MRVQCQFAKLWTENKGVFHRLDGRNAHAPAKRDSCRLCEAVGQTRIAAPNSVMFALDVTRLCGHAVFPLGWATRFGYSRVGL
jgi:hypothetical protein